MRLRTTAFCLNITEIMTGSTNFTSETLQGVDRNFSDSSIEHCATARTAVVPKEFKIAVHVFTLVVALVGNSLLIAAYKRMREPVMLLIANMATSDLLTAIFLLPRLITIAIVDSLAWQVQGLGGTILCKMCTFLSDISLFVSTQSLVIITVERFLAVVHPLKVRNITAKMRHLLIALTWISAMALHSPYLYTMELVKHVKNNATVQVCQSIWAVNNRPAFIHYEIVLFGTVLLLPLTVISILYPIIVIYLRRDKFAAERSSRGKKRSRERSMKLLKLAAATVLSLIICWVPYSVINFLRLFNPSTLPACSHILITEYVSLLLAWSYCAVNPFICFIFLRDFRRELGNIPKRRKRGASTKYDIKIRGEIQCDVVVKVRLSEI